MSGTFGTSAITLFSDGDYAFVSQEYGSNNTSFLGAVEVFHVDRAKNGTMSSSHIGYTKLGFAVAGTALSSDGPKLYATSQLVSLNSTQGTLSILNVTTLKTNPSEALLVSVEAGCNPVRVAVSPKGKHGFPRIITGLFPREFALSPDGRTLLISDYGSGAVQAVNVSQLTRPYLGEELEECSKGKEVCEKWCNAFLREVTQLRDFNDQTLATVNRSPEKLTKFRER
jgi:hypothetical protein